MSPKLALAGLALMVGTSSFATTYNGGTVFTPDPVAETLGGLHFLDGSAFVDTFNFQVTGAGVAASIAFTPTFNLNGDPSGSAFSFNVLYLADALNNPLAGAIDIDGSDGWSVLAALPSAGTYRVIVGGTSPTVLNDSGAPEQGFYIGGLATVQVNAVPEPSTYGLMGVGLLAMAALRRRRR